MIVNRNCLAIIVSVWLLMALWGIAIYGVALIPFCAWGVFVYVRGTKEAIRRYRDKR